ncbi:MULTISPECIES: MFS transporter [unclassified Microbacterium]|uniref:MFS transporter n=1 Tax=unclassified Microbacterium TaxID=2609290 RepID=UPI002035EFB4|nr:MULTISPECIES: MFS transporter [unclassified Microbacterium]
MIGTTVEWYDVIIYAQTAGLVLATLFFAPVAGDLGLLLTFGSVGVTFIFRPLGAILSSFFGDRIGRKPVMVATLLLMGIATTLIGLLPTHASIGVLAPIILVLLRILQGIAVGGEWGAAALLAVESAATRTRGRQGSFPQLGVPMGLLLASGVLALVAGVIAPGEAYLEWGWRIPFLFSIVLVAIGFWVRRSVDETPVFLDLAKKRRQTKVPLATLLKRYWLVVVLAGVLFAGNNASGQMLAGGFLASYATDSARAVPLLPAEVSLATLIGSVMWLVSTYVAGGLSDRFGRRPVFVIGYAALALAALPFFWLSELGSFALLTVGCVIFAVGLGISYGAIPAWYAELFPADVRYAGVSLSYTLGNVLGGALSPLIAVALVQSTGSITTVGLYLIVMCALSIVAAFLLRDRTRIDLSIDNAEEQRRGITVFDRNDSPARV